MTVPQFLTIPIVLTTVITIVNVILLLGLKTKYDEAKQTNQATKEDIGDITKIVEDVKNELLQKTESLKAELSLFNQHKLSWKSAEREAIINYNKELTAWIYAIARTDFNYYDIHNYKKALQVEATLNEYVYKVDLAEGHLTIFMRDKVIMDLKTDLSLEIVKFMNLTNRFIGEVIYILKDYAQTIAITTDSESSEQIKEESYHVISEKAKSFRPSFLNCFMEVNKKHVKLMEELNRRMTNING